MWRAFAAFLVLTLAGLNGMIASAGDTCTQNSPDSLFGYIFTLPLNLLGIGLLCWKPTRWAVIIATVIPVLLALPYTRIAIDLASGTPACTILTGDPSWAMSGEETGFAIGWGLSALIFWMGLAYALSGGYRPAHDTEQ